MMTIPAPSSRAGIWSALMSASRLIRTGGAAALFSRSKISASDPLASTKTPRTAISVILLRRDAGERQHGVHQDVRAGRAIGLRRVLELVVADAVLAGHEHHRRRHDGVEIAGVVTGARGNAPVRIAERLGGVLHRIDQFCIKVRRRLAPDQVERDVDLAPPRDLGCGSAQLPVERVHDPGISTASIDGEGDLTRHNIARGSFYNGASNTS